MADPQQPEAERVPPVTAFLVVLNAETNQFEFVTKVGGVPMQREADINDVNRACFEIGQNIGAMKAAAETVNVQMARLEQMAKRDMLAGGGDLPPGLDLKNLRRPLR